jgi:hypothetical protein
MTGVEAFVGIRMQNSGLRNPTVQQWEMTIPSHLRALTATDQNIPPQPAYATPVDTQLTRVPRNRMVLVVTQHNPPKPFAHVGRAIVPPILKLSLDDFELRDHPLLRRDPPDVKGSAAREVSTEVGEPQKREGFRFSLATPLSVSDGEPPELYQPRLVRM